MVMVKKFLCGICLQRGSYIIGIISTVAAILRVIVYSWLEEKISEMTPEITDNIVYLHGVEGISFIIVLVSFAEFCLGLSLFIGTRQDWCIFVNAWLKSHLWLIPIDFIFYLLLSIIYLLTPLVGLGICILVYGVVHAAVTSYFFLVVRSFYIEKYDD